MRRFASRLVSPHVKEPVSKAGGEASVGEACVDVLFVNGCDLPTLRRYRVTHQREQLELWGISTDEVHYGDVTAACAEWAGVFLVYRCPLTEPVAQLIARAHQLGKKVYFDVDDLVIDTAYTNKLPVVQAMTPEEKAVFDDGVLRNGQTLKLCDGAIATTGALAAELGKYVPEVFINRNVASQEMLELSDKAHARRAKVEPGKVMLGYFSGSMTHNADFLELLPALVEVMGRYPQVELKTVGELELPDELMPFADRVEASPYVGWRELPMLIASVDINLAPIEDTLFNRAKSENKWMEAALVGVPTVASNVGAFADSIIDGRTGFLCSNTEEWVSALGKLIEDLALRGSVGEQARNYCLLHNTSVSTGWRLAEKLSKRPRTIESLTPASDKGKEALVRAYLSSRGYSKCSATYDSEPWQHISLEERIAEMRNAKAAGKRVAVALYERYCGDWPTFRYFGYNVAQCLRKSAKWASTYLFVDELDEGEELFETASAFYFIRCRIRPEILEFARKVKAMSKPIAYLIDDYALGAATSPHVINIMANKPNDEFEQAFWRGLTVRFELASKLADCVIVPNGYFADILSREYDRPVRVIHSFLNDEQVEVAEKIHAFKEHQKSGVFSMGYFSGSPSHQEDFLSIKHAVVQFLTACDDARLVLCGFFSLDDDLYVLLREGKIILLPRVDYVTLQHLQASVDVVLAPLVEGTFSNCKSALKVYEAGVVGTPACASPSFGYSEAVEQGVSGILCASTEEWLGAFELMHSKRDLMGNMGREARRIALSHFYGETPIREIEFAFDGLVTAQPMSPDYEELDNLLSSKEIKDWDNTFEANPAFA